VRSFVLFFPFWHVLPRKIWQPWERLGLTNKKGLQFARNMLNPFARFTASHQQTICSVINSKFHPSNYFILFVHQSMLLLHPFHASVYALLFYAIAIFLYSSLHHRLTRNDCTFKRNVGQGGNFGFCDSCSIWFWISYIRESSESRHRFLSHN
jgi:hypothetical protein